MGCEICGRGNCTRSYHSIEEQNEHDSVADNIKEYVQRELLRKLDRFTTYESEETTDLLVSLDEVRSIINDIA